MSKEKCSSENPTTCRYHGHEAKVALVQEQRQEAEAKKDFEGYFNATKTLEALEKKKQIVDGLEESFDQATASGDFNAYFELAKNVEAGINGETEKHAPKKRVSRKAQSQLVGSDGNTYSNSLHPSFQNGVMSPERVFIKSDDNEYMAFVRADSYSHNVYPKDMCIQASRPISQEEMKHIAQLTGYQYQQTLNGEGMSDPVRSGDSSFMIGSDMTKASGRKSCLSDFEGGLQETIQDGSRLLTTNRNGPGTMGTRTIEGIGKDATFTLYYKENKVKFDK